MSTAAPPAVRAFLGLGSNLGERHGHLRDAVAGLPDVVAVSPLYETDPVGGPGGQGRYLNCVVELRTRRDARALLEAGQRAEADAGRVRSERWGPRTLDVDVLLVGGALVDEPDLVVPHPHLGEREFVLVPLADLAPEVVGALGTPAARRALGGGASGVRPAGTLVRSQAARHTPGPEQFTSPAAWRQALDDRRAPGPVGLVPTMGALHGGHLSMIRRARAECAVVAVTDYVNPLQFGPAEDLSTYPRDVAGDAELAGEAGADLLFAPSQGDLWPEPGRTSLHVAGLSEGMEGAARPGHFDGVATIVAKLLALSGPCRAYFGEKDFQQLAVVRRLVADLSLPVQVVACPTVREPDGLALSSRNAYLSPEQRAVAPTLYHALLAGKRAVEDDGITDADEVVAAMTAVLIKEPRCSLDYAEVADPVDLHRPASIGGEVRLLVAARIGRARLIDNLAALSPHPAPAGSPG
ncbi:MAG: pantoate--beta-alanine ligase [Acidimicrobiales bacterium]